MIEKVIDFLCKICYKMNENLVGQRIILFARKTGIQRIFVYFYYKKHFKNPTNKMIDSQQFYQKNQERIQLVVDMLADDKSKEVFEKMIEFRQTCDTSKFPYFKEQDQYFPKDIIRIYEDEVFIDCGAYNGDTLRSFLGFCRNKYKKVVCFEPDTNNHMALNEYIDSKNMKNVHCINAGAWNKQCTLCFGNGNAGSSSLIFEQEKTIEINVLPIDEVAICKDASFIKMDIEGAEMNALKGARHIIQTNKPKLAICIYHSDEEMLSIPEYIHSLVPEYRLYVRQHNFRIAETVLYAII